MATVENILDVLYNVESYETPKNKMSEDELRSLDTKHVKDWEVPEGSEFVGGYFAPYHDVTVYRGTDGKYYSVWFSIGD